MHALATAAAAAELDELTLRRAQLGEQRAWRELIARYQQPVHACIWRLLAGRAQHRAPDLTQETFVRVLRALPRFVPAGRSESAPLHDRPAGRSESAPLHDRPAGAAKLSTWILTIATRLALNELRRPDPVPLVGELVAHERTDTSIERKRLGAAIAAGVTALPDAQRAVLVLREYHDLDYAEIADVLELDVGTVKSRLSRARAALRDHLRTAVPELEGRT
jgi:RNA polymerase sigma-70 factor (ECF subfamily)